MRIIKAGRAAALAATIAIVNLGAVTRVPSADGQFWDIQDTSPWAQDSGGIATGGRANPFNGFGYLKLQVRRADNTLLARNQYLKGFGLHHDGAGRFDSITPVLTEGILVARDVTTTEGHAIPSLSRYVHQLHDRRAHRPVAWGGAAGAYEDGGLAAVATTANGDRQIDLSDTFVTVMQNAKRVANPAQGPSGHGPSAHVLGQGRPGVLTSVGDMYGDPFTSTWPGFDPAHIGYVFTLRLRPGETRALMTFVVKGLSEVYDPRGGYPIPYQGRACSRVKRCMRAPTQEFPQPGSEITRGHRHCGTTRQGARRSRADARGNWTQIANWNLVAPPVKTVLGLRENRRRTAGGDDHRRRDVRGHRARVSRPALALRSQRSHVPRGAVDQSARDRRRACARRRARRRQSAQSVPRRAHRLQGQHRRHRAADHRWFARARRSSSAPGFARRRRHEARRRRRARQSQSR